MPCDPEPWVPQKEKVIVAVGIKVAKVTSERLRIETAVAPELELKTSEGQPRAVTEFHVEGSGEVGQSEGHGTKGGRQDVEVRLHMITKVDLKVETEELVKVKVTVDAWFEIPRLCHVVLVTAKGIVNGRDNCQCKCRCAGHTKIKVDNSELHCLVNSNDKGPGT